MGAGVGSWGFDPFDNDTAAMWLLRYQDAPADRRPGLIREALIAVLAGGNDYLDSDFAFEAVAAAAVVVAAPPDDPEPDDPELAGLVLAGLVAAALDRVAGERSEWRSLWEEAGPASLEAVLGSLARIRAAVTPPGGDDLKYLTYTKYNPETGHVYTGRLSGHGDPEAILEAFDRHHPLNARGFQPARVDVWAAATKPYAGRRSDRAYQAIRGREHGGIEANRRSGPAPGSRGSR